MASVPLLLIPRWLAGPGDRSATPSGPHGQQGGFCGPPLAPLGTGNSLLLMVSTSLFRGSEWRTVKLCQSEVGESWLHFHFP